MVPDIASYTSVMLVMYKTTELPHLAVKVLSHDAIFLATCNAILLLRDVN